jgi:hypothetical protein
MGGSNDELTFVNRLRYLIAKLSVTGSCMSITTASSSLVTARDR